MKRRRELSDGVHAAPEPGRRHTYIKVELAGVSRHGIRQIHEVIERVMEEERADEEKDDDNQSEKNSKGPFAERNITQSGVGRQRLEPTRADDSSRAVELVYEPGFVIDRVGSQEIPRDIQNPHTWEAWSIPKYELISSTTNVSQSHQNISSCSENTVKSADVVSKHAPADHQSRQARGRFHKGWSASKRVFTPGKLSPELRAALGMSEDEETKVPWLDRMRRYGYPPAFVMESMKGQLKPETLKVLDGDDDNEDFKKAEKGQMVKIATTSECALKLLEFPLYLHPGRGLNHPGFWALRNDSTRSASPVGLHEDDDFGLYVAPCPINMQGGAGN